MTMEEDGKIDYSEYSLKDLKEAVSSIDRTRFPMNYSNMMSAIEARKLEDPTPVKPRVDIHSADHSAPEMSFFSFGPRCPACGWKKPLILSGSKFNKPFSCADCSSRLNITSTHRRLNTALMVLLVPAFSWFSFGGLEGVQKAAIATAAIFLVFLEYWFTRLELVPDDTGNKSSN